MSPARSLLRALVLLVTTVLVTATAAVVTAGTAEALAPATSAHPYSDPVWYPMRVSTRMDCVKNNPGCRNPHPEWMMDVVPDGQAHSTSHAGVYSMGAGIVHYGDAHGASCGKENSYGTWIWIDHGAGTLSRYGHLSKITVRNGQTVAAGAQIGVVGTTGKKANCHIAYTNFSIQKKGLKTSNGVEFPTLRACSARTGATQTWPNAISRYTRWNAMRQGTTIPASSGSCIPNSVPRTATRPTGVHVAAGKGKFRISWARPAAAYRVSAVMVEISEWHTGGKYWDLPRNSRFVAVPASKASVTVTKLTKKRLHRIRLTFRNAAGWSRQTAWIKHSTKK